VHRLLQFIGFLMLSGIVKFLEPRSDSLVVCIHLDHRPALIHRAIHAARPFAFGLDAARVVVAP